ncbi:MAG: hypothetical protein PVSMB1_07530 [Gemmatimonadaceae bacterium]
MLLIACLNLAAAFVSRSFSREREFAIRAALGSGRARLIRQLLTEAGLIAAMGTGLWVGIAFAAIQYVRFATPIELPVGAELRVSGASLLLTAGLSLGTVAIFGLMPATIVARIDLQPSLKSGGRTSTGAPRHHLAKGLLALQASLSVVLLTGAGLLISSVLRMETAPLGFEPDHVLTIAVMIPPERYSTESQRLRFFEELRNRINAVPGVTAAAITSALPPSGGGLAPLDIEGRSPHASNGSGDVGLQVIDTAYFSLMRTPMRAGRIFDERDRSGSPAVAIIDEALRRKYFVNDDPVGRRIRVDTTPPSPWLSIVGVVASQKRTRVDAEMQWLERPMVFRPANQTSPLAVSLVIRVDQGASVPGVRIQAVLMALDPDVPVNNIVSMPDRISRLLTYPAVPRVAAGGLLRRRAPDLRDRALWT